MRSLTLASITLALAFGPPASAADPPTRDEALAALRKATAFFRKDVAVHGGFLWAYSGDLKLREGEGKVEDLHTVWVQPPGTPTIGMAFLTAYEATKDPADLEAARQAAAALVSGQLRSGGWAYRVLFDPDARKKWAFRVDGNPDGDNHSTLDDDTTQAALRCLMRVDRALGGKDKPIHEAVEYGLSSLLKAQYPNGGWAQGYRGPVDPAGHPVKKANYPESWPRTWTKTAYWVHYTLNDAAQMDTMDALFLAADLYGDARYRGAAVKGGDFLLLAQMPDPQPAWAQQYDADMHPVWARKFEPPAVTGWESQPAMEMLLQVYRRTGDKKYLEAVGRALPYLKKSQLPNGRLARFYELKTNKPLYMTRQYELTYKDDDLPTHYGFTQPSRLAAIEAEYDRLRAADPAKLAEPPPEKPSAAKVRAVIDGLDSRGAWVDKGRLRFHDVVPASGVIRSQTFAANVETLARYATK